MAGSDESPTFNPDALGLLSQIWSMRELAGDLEMISFLLSEKRVDRTEGEVKDWTDKMFGRVRSYGLVDDEAISEIKSSPPDEIKSRVDALVVSLRQTHDEVIRELCKIPPSSEKSASYLEAEYRYDSLPWEALIWKSFQQGTALDRVRQYRDEKGDLPPSKASMQGIKARDFSHYQVALGLSGGHPDSHVLDFEREYQTDLWDIQRSWSLHLESHTNSHLPTRPEFISPAIIDVSLSLWLWSSETRFRERFRHDLNSLVTLLLRFVLPSGALWEVEPSPFTNNDAGGRPLDYVQIPSVRATGMLANSLFALGREEWIVSYAVKACEWLSSQQQSDGGWPARSSGGDQETDVFATYLSIEALRLSGQTAYEHCVKRGRSRLLELQDGTGAWETAEAFDVSFVTRKILEHMTSKFPDDVGGTIGSLRGTAREFLMISKQLRMQGGSAELKMATVALAHSLEFSLYAILCSVNIDFFQSDGSKTIGARQAMRKLEDHLVEVGLLGGSSGLQYKSQLSMMITSRDAVIHKNASVSESELAGWLSEVEGFLHQYG